MLPSLILALGLGLAQQPVDTPLVITNVTVLPMDRDRVLPAHSVIVERGVITHLGPSGTLTVPAGARAIDGTGKYVSLRGTAQILELRNAVNAGRVLGPTFYTVGPYINQPFFTTPDEVERAVVEQKRAGYDFIKLHGSLSREAYHRLNEVARREGIRVVGHLPRNLGPNDVLPSTST